MCFEFHACPFVDRITGRYLSAGFFRSQTRSRINLVSGQGGTSFSTAVYFTALSCRASRSSIWILWRELLSVWWARARTRTSVFTGANDISKADLLRLFRSSQIEPGRPGQSLVLIPSLSVPPPLTPRPSSCHFLPLPPPFSFSSTATHITRILRSYCVSPLHRFSPPSSLSSPPLLRNVHQLFLSFHISSPFIFFVCKPGIPDRRECSRLCNGEWTHGAENGPRREERREVGLGEVGNRASKARTLERPMQRRCSCVNLVGIYVTRRLHVD